METNRASVVILTCCGKEQDKYNGAPDLREPIVTLQSVIVWQIGD